MGRKRSDQLVEVEEPPFIPGGLLSAAYRSGEAAKQDAAASIVPPPPDPGAEDKSRMLKVAGTVLALMGVAALIPTAVELFSGGGPKGLIGVLVRLIPGPALVIAGLVLFEKGRLLEPHSAMRAEDEEYAQHQRDLDAMFTMPRSGTGQPRPVPAEPKPFVDDDAAVLGQSQLDIDAYSQIDRVGHLTAPEPAAVPAPPQPFVPPAPLAARAPAEEVARGAYITPSLKRPGSVVLGSSTGLLKDVDTAQIPVTSPIPRPSQPVPPAPSMIIPPPPPAPIGSRPPIIPPPPPATAPGLGGFAAPTGAPLPAPPVVATATADPVLTPDSDLLRQAQASVEATDTTIVERYRQWILSQTLGQPGYEPLTVTERFDEWFLLSASSVATLLAWTHEDHGATYSAETWIDQILPTQGIGITDRLLASDLLRAAAMHAGGIHTAPTERLVAYHPAELVTAMATLHVGLLRLYSGLEGTNPSKVLRDQFGDAVNELSATPNDGGRRWLPPGS